LRLPIAEPKALGRHQPLGLGRNGRHAARAAPLAGSSLVRGEDSAARQSRRARATRREARFRASWRRSSPQQCCGSGGRLAPFGLAGLWENWRNPTGEWERTFAIITVPSNKLVGQIHDRMPAIIEPAGYDRWLGLEPDPRDLLITYPSEPMTIWTVSTRVNQPENDDPALLDHIADPFDAWAPLRSEGRA
jgi:SOS response associated peptidase (SRAP)